MAGTAQTGTYTRKSWVKRHRALLLALGPLSLLAGGGYLYLTGGRYVSTDDAYIQAARVAISANVAGRVVAVAVHDNEAVHQGQVLVRLDERPFRIAVEAARAALAAARLQVQALEATYLQRKADERAAQDTVSYERSELARQQKLTASGISSARQLDRQRHALQTARQALAAAEQKTAATFAELSGEPGAPVDSHPQVQRAQAALDRAELALSYTVIRAPMDGIVTKVEQVQVGDYIRTGAALFALVSQRDMWVEANFKETEVTYMRPGQSANFSVDAFPGVTFTGKVQSTSPGTGSDFSLLPPENSSGNWVKVVQRVPVRISIDGSHTALPLAAGMSVDAEVDTRHHRSLPFWPHS